MPSTATHAYFIMDIYDKLPIERKIFLKDDKELLKVSAQSMDPLNFYFSKNFKKNKKVRSFAEYFHTHKTGEFLITLTNYIKYNYYASKSDVMAYLYGMISHYVLDTTFHPYVYYKTGEFKKNVKDTYIYNSKHHEFETAIDRYLIKLRENVIPYKYKLYKEVFNISALSNDLKDVINFTYRETFHINDFDKVLLHSIKDMRLAFKLLRYDKIGIKYRFYKLIDIISSKKTLKLKFVSYYYKTDMDFLNEEHKTWYYPTNKRKKYNMSFRDLYIKALSDALHIIKEVDAYIYDNKKVNLEKLFKDLSYKTGVPLKQRQELKYFEF